MPVGCGPGRLPPPFLPPPPLSLSLAHKTSGATPSGYRTRGLAVQAARPLRHRSRHLPTRTRTGSGQRCRTGSIRPRTNRLGVLVMPVSGVTAPRPLRPGRGAVAPAEAARGRRRARTERPGNGLGRGGRPRAGRAGRRAGMAVGASPHYDHRLTSARPGPTRSDIGPARSEPNRAGPGPAGLRARRGPRAAAVAVGEAPGPASRAAPGQPDRFSAFAACQWPVRAPPLPCAGGARCGTTGRTGPAGPVL